LNDKRANAEIHNILGSFGKPATKTKGLKLSDFDTYNNMKIMNSFSKHKNIHTCT
jgi:hypothetical protein